MFEYKIDNITIYNRAAFDVKNEKFSQIENKLAKWIVKNLEREILKEILERNYEGFNENDKKYIVEKTIAILEKTKALRERHIANQLKEYFIESSLINVPGFVRFRLKAYKKELERALDKVIDIYLCQREYHDFIEMIKEYICLQEPLVSVLNIMSTETKVRYFDENMTELTAMFEKELSFEKDLTVDDKMLTILVLSAPRKIIWHNSRKSKNEELKRTMRKIFGDSLVICDGCQACMNN